LPPASTFNIGVPFPGLQAGIGSSSPGKVRRFLTPRSTRSGYISWVEFEGRRLEVHLVDAVKNAKRSRVLRRDDQAVPPHSAFDPPKALLDQATGRVPRKDGEP
jgi:hypothetical protein